METLRVKGSSYVFMIQITSIFEPLFLFYLHLPSLVFLAMFRAVIPQLSH